MRSLARTLGRGPAAALFAGLTYAASGFLLSALTFYNLLTVAAWWPVVMAGVLRTDRRGLLIAGAACGLAIYGGERTTWSDGSPIVVLQRERGDSSHRVVADKVPGFAEANEAAWERGAFRPRSAPR